MFRSAFVLATLQATAQLLTIIALPVISRLYSPHDFNTLAGFTSATAIFTVVIALRLELAIPIVHSESEAAHLLWACGAACVALAALVTLALYSVLPLHFLDDALNLVLPYLPLALFVGGVQSVFTYYMVRRKRLALMGFTVVIQTVVGVSTQLVLGYYAAEQSGLVVGYMANIATGAILLFVFAGLPADAFRLPSMQALASVARSNSRYMRYSTLDALLNTSSLQLPLFLIASIAEGATGGFLLMAIRLLYTPSTIISGGFAKHYHSCVGDASRRQTLRKLTSDTLFYLLLLGGSFVLMATTAGPDLVGHILGADWGRTGTYFMWLAPWIVLQVLASPISTVLLATGKQKQLMKLSLIGFTLRVGSVAVCLAAVPAATIAALSLSSAIFYLCILTASCREAGVRLVDMTWLFAKCSPFWLAAWLSAQAMLDSVNL